MSEWGIWPYQPKPHEIQDMLVASYWRRQYQLARLNAVALVNTLGEALSKKAKAEEEMTPDEFFGSFE